MYIFCVIAGGWFISFGHNLMFLKSCFSLELGLLGFIHTTISRHFKG